MLTNVVELQAAIGIRPKPTLGPVKSGAIFVSARQIPKRDGHRLAVDPFPVFRVRLVSHGSQPVLAVCIAL